MMVDKILEYVREMEDYYYNLAVKALNEGKMTENSLLTAQATAFQRVRYYIEGLQEREAQHE